MIQMRRCVCAFLALAAILALAGCGEAQTPVPSGMTELTAPPRDDGAEADADDAAPADPTDIPAAVEVGPEGIPLSPEEIQALLNGPAWEGVYRMDDLTAVLKDRQDDLAVLMIFKGEELLFKGFVQVSSDRVTYDAEAFSLALSLDETQMVLFVALRGELPSGVNVSGLYDRTAEDPAAYQAELNAARLPATISETVSRGRVVMIYVDPQGRFSAMFPSLFTAAPGEEQPEDGVYLTEATGTYTLRISVEASPWESLEEAEAAIAETVPGSETVRRADGCLLTRTEENGILRTVITRLTGGNAVTMEFYCPERTAALEDYVALLTISDS